MMSLKILWFFETRGIYKITFLPLRLFSYYGSSLDLGARFKYHYYNGPKQSNFLGLVLKMGLTFQLL